MYQIMICWREGQGPIRAQGSPEQLILDGDHYNMDIGYAFSASKFMSTFPQVEWTEVRKDGRPQYRFVTGEVVPLDPNSPR